MMSCIVEGEACAGAFLGGALWAIPYPAAAILKFCAKVAVADMSPLTMRTISIAAGTAALAATPYPNILLGVIS